MDLRELSFKSAEPVPSIPYQRYQIRLLSGVSSEAKEKELGKNCLQSEESAFG